MVIWVGAYSNVECCVLTYWCSRSGGEWHAQRSHATQEHDFHLARQQIPYRKKEHCAVSASNIVFAIMLSTLITMLNNYGVQEMYF